MQVDHRHASEAHEEDRREDVVEACQDYELGTDAGDRCGHRRVGGRAIRIRAEREDGARDACESGPLQSGNTGVIRDDDRYTGIELA